MLTGRPYEERIYAAGSPGALLSRNLTTYDQTAVEGGIYPGQWQVPINVRAVRSISIEFEPANAGALATMTETVYDTAGSTDPAYFSSLNANAPGSRPDQTRAPATGLRPVPSTGVHLQPT